LKQPSPIEGVRECVQYDLATHKPPAPASLAGQALLRGRRVATLHIEHPITDLVTWLGAFGRFAEARKSAGVKAQRVHQPVDDDNYICIELDFDTVDEAQAFRRFLESKVWSSLDASPGLGGTPRTRVLRSVDTGR